jgi:hypothetical protein
MREICTSGSVGGEGGNILAYPAQSAEGACPREETIKHAWARPLRGLCPPYNSARYP